MATGLLEALGLRKPKAAAGTTAPATAAPATASPPPTDSPPPPGGRARSGAMSESVPGGDAAEKRFKAFADRVDAELKKAEVDVEAQPVAALKTTLQAELKKLQDDRKAADALDKTAGAAKVVQLDGPAHTFTLRAATLKKNGIEGQRQIREWGTDPLAALATKVAALEPDLKKALEPRLKQLQQRLVAAQAMLDKGDFDGLVVAAGQLFYACQDFTTAVDSAAVEKPKFDELRRNVVIMFKRMKESGLPTPAAARTWATWKRRWAVPTRSARSRAGRRRPTRSTASSSRRRPCATATPPTRISSPSATASASSPRR